jgi:hypothetical protein
MFTPVLWVEIHTSIVEYAENTANRPCLYCETPTIRRFGNIYSLICAVSWRNFAKVSDLVVSISMLIWASERFSEAYKM